MRKSPNVGVVLACLGAGRLFHACGDNEMNSDDTDLAIHACNRALYFPYGPLKTIITNSVCRDLPGTACIRSRKYKTGTCGVFEKNCFGNFSLMFRVNKY